MLQAAHPSAVVSVHTSEKEPSTVDVPAPHDVGKIVRGGGCHPVLGGCVCCVRLFPDFHFSIPDCPNCVCFPTWPDLGAFFGHFLFIQSREILLTVHTMASMTENPDDFFSPALPECRASSQPSLPQFVISWLVHPLLEYTSSLYLANSPPPDTSLEVSFEAMPYSPTHTITPMAWRSTWRGGKIMISTSAPFSRLRGLGNCHGETYTAPG